MPTKFCKHCDSTKDDSEFYKYGRGLSAWCKPCHRLWAIERKKRFPRTPRSSPSVRLSAIEKLANEMWRNMCKRRPSTGREVSLSRDSLLSKLNLFCEENYFVLEPWHPFRPSVDRIDNGLGYTEENTRIVWYIENCCRNRFSDSDVLEFCRRKLGIQKEDP